MLAFRESSVYLVSGSRFGGIVLVTDITNGHVFGRFLVRNKANGEFFQQEFHSTINTVDNHQNFDLCIGSSPEEGEQVTVEACECVTSIELY